MTVVIDASVLVSALMDRDEAAEAVRASLAPVDLIAPHLVDLEVMQGLRRHDRKGRHDAVRALRQFRLLEIRRFDHEPLLPRIWELRHNLTAYDAAYVALAEVVGAPLFTSDRSIVNAPGHHAEVIVL
ncbi:MAG: type II toxin-antitoxin system VapC family toxin [Actinomycetota bacterium]|nr:type II toxin-antitoxin system VapC family toxin [Actinomycetota bacterium]